MTFSSMERNATQRAVVVEARKVAERVLAIVQPVGEKQPAKSHSCRPALFTE